MTENIEVRLSLNAAGFTSGGTQAKRTISDLNSELTKMKSLASGALAFSGIGLGVGELVRVADQYGQITGRLRLATKATGDFAEVQGALQKTAEDTRAPLQDTVNLYAQIAPSLAAVGIDSVRTVGIIKTVNQAIALSGASAEAGAAALTQFTQGLASGTLRGEELNSILEQTPALADAIAKGLGVTRGELRALGADGELTAQVVAQALERVSGSIDADFKTIPLTVGQSLTLLQNAFSEALGSFDQATGGTTSLANGIREVADGIKSLGQAAETLQPVVSFVQISVDAVSRLFKVAGTALAGFVVNVKQVLSGDLKGALETVFEIGRRVDAILQKPLAGTTARTNPATDPEVQRRLLLTDLAEKLAKQENLRAVAAGEASASILKSDKALADARTKLAEDSLKARLKGEETLAENLRKASEKSLVDAQQARDAATALRTQGKDARTAAADKATERRGRDLTDQQRSDQAERDASTLSAKATLTTIAAQSAAREGDLKRATKLADDAAKLADRASKAADSILNNDDAAKALEDIGRIQEKVLGAQADIKDREAADLEQRAQQQNQLLAEAETRITAIKAEMEKPVTLQADITKAAAEVETLQKQIDALQDKTVTVTVNTVQQTSDTTAPAPAPSLNDYVARSVAGFDRGGWTGPGGKFQPAGIVHANEFVLRSEVTRQPGVLDFMTRFNRDGIAALRGYAAGGLVSNVAAPAIPARQASSMEGRVLEFPGIGRFPVQMERALADNLEKTLRLERLKAGAR